MDINVLGPSARAQIQKNTLLFRNGSKRSIVVIGWSRLSTRYYSKALHMAGANTTIQGQILTEETVGETSLTWDVAVEEVKRTGGFSGSMGLYASRADEAPEHNTDTAFRVGQVVASAPIDLTDYPERRWHEGKELIGILCIIKVIPAPEHGTLSFKMTIEDKEVGTATIRYVD